MTSYGKFRKRFVSLLFIIGLLTVAGLLLGFTNGPALGSAPAAGLNDVNSMLVTRPSSSDIAEPNAACSGGPVIDGVTLDECVDNSFVVGGGTKTVRVWYTKVVGTVQRTEEGVTYNLTHYINSDAEAQNVAQWGREAWEMYYQVFGRHPYNNGCGDRINVQLEDGIGWSGIAYWASSGHCSIGIDSPVIRNGGGQGVVYHEFQHYMQYAFNDGCYGYLKPHYDADAEFVEGYADIAEDSVDATLDLTLFNNFIGGYDPTTSFYDKGYNDVFNKYFSEQLGVLYTPTDPQWHFDAVRRHYEMCDAQDTLYVLDDLVPSLQPSLSEEKLFLNFFAANWAHKWANSATQPELVIFDEAPGPDYGSIPLYKDVNISTGTQSWPSETNPDDWAARYYQVKPQSGCAFVTAKVDGAAGAHLGISLMAADTSAPTSVVRTAWIGEDLSRTFPGFGTYDRIVAVVNAFASKYSYSVSFTCVTPELAIQEPRQANFALVGEPSSPIAFLARFKVTTGGEPVLGLPETAFTAEAEGGAVTIVPGSLSQVSEEYWAIMAPPIKPDGTTFVDLKICLSGTICDTETHALLYADPGNTDFALVFDASGSMKTEDIIGEGARYINAQKAGTVLADLLRVGDRILVTDFGAYDNPVSCGLPYGDGNCALHLVTRLARTDVTAPASTAIAMAKVAISNFMWREEWTPIGAALQDAMNKLIASPANVNPKHIILLSDGEENVNPLYASVKDQLVASGVVVDTIRFSQDAPGALLAQIAADTGGSYSYVPTTGGALAAQEQSQQMVDQITQTGISVDQVNQFMNTAEQAQQQLVDQFSQMGIPSELSSQLTAASLPGPLGLDNVYDYYETKGQSAARLTHQNFLNLDYSLGTSPWTGPTLINVDESVNVLRIVVASKLADTNDWCTGDRRVEIAQPTESPRPTWIPVSPPDGTTPASWQIRHSQFDDVVMIPNPAPGTWQVRSNYALVPCNAVQAPSAGAIYDVMINSSAESNIQLTARFLPPLDDGVGAAGEYVPIVATLLNRNGAMPNAIVGAYVERPGGAVDSFILWDDGLHDDGGAGDGVYGNLYRTAIFGGTYNVRVGALFLDPAGSGQILIREWNGSFFMTPDDNPDGDFLPAGWELLCGLDPTTNDLWKDKDLDGLINGLEYLAGTLPCDADTDDGGERDGSEIFAQPSMRNPLYAPDDIVRRQGHINVIALDGKIRIEWTHAGDFSNMRAWIETIPFTLTNPVNMGNSGIYTVTVPNGDYFVRLAGQNGDAWGDFSDVMPVTPRPDPFAPSGGVLINNGAIATNSKYVTLNIGATDSRQGILPESIDSSSSEVNGGIEMRISNDPLLTGAAWEPLNPERRWRLANGPVGIYAVYVQFRDAAGNNSLIASDTIIYTGIYTNETFLPITVK